MALVGKVNREIVTALNRHGSYGVGLSGEDARLLHVEARDARLGFVGDVRHVDPAILERVLREDLIPVVATIGVDDVGQAYNVNADAVAGAIARALQAERLVYLTDVAGIYEDYGDDSSLVSETDAAGLERLVAEGRIGEGMIPKVRSCLDALAGGVRRAHVLDGRVPHVLLLELFTREGIGTVIDP
jgi:acetylglutamate kinase